MSLKSWEHFFKPEVRTSGRSLLSKDKVSLAQPSDTEIQSYVRGSTSFKVIFKCSSVSSQTVTADCTCPLSKKGQFCKHIWAVLLLIDQKKPDFLDSKSELQKALHTTSETATVAKKSETQAASQASFKLKQADYRKQQYQLQKQRLKNQKLSAKASKFSVDYPPDVEKALKYFLDNGFPLKQTLTKESVSIAMKKLARVFHPDAGGHHEEILELNRYAEVLVQFLKV